MLRTTQKANQSSASHNKWKCTYCELDDKTHPSTRFRGTPLKDWFLYQLVRNCNSPGYFLKGVTHRLPYSSFFNDNKTGTPQERHLYKICRGSQLCVKLLKRLDSQILKQVTICEDYQPLFYLDNTTTRNREISWFPSLDFLDTYLWEPLHPALTHTGSAHSEWFQTPLFPQGYKHFEHLIENPTVAIENSIIRLE